MATTWWSAAILAAALAPCGCAGPAPEPAARVQPAHRIEVALDPMVVSWREPARVRASEMGPSEPGFTFCCGVEGLKIEIDCSDMLKRCYRRDADGAWHATYGRQCKERLGLACYTDECDARCQ